MHSFDFDDLSTSESHDLMHDPNAHHVDSLHDPNVHDPNAYDLQQSQHDPYTYDIKQSIHAPVYNSNIHTENDSNVYDVSTSSNQIHSSNNHTEHDPNQHISKKITFKGYGSCHSCSCRAFTGFGECCDNCGHNYHDHY